MKINSLFTEISIFLAVLLFLILPPIFGNASTGEVVVIEWNFPFVQLFSALLAVVLLVYYKKKRNEKINVLGFRIFLTTGLLFASFFILNFLARVIPSWKIESNVDFKSPDSFITWFFCILNFLFSSFYEEVLYRFYFTDTLKSIFREINPIFENRIFTVIFEIAGCAVFAFAHSYLGIFPVINAAIAHFILRYAYKKSNSIIPGWTAHFAYNIISMILS